jgi:hypothetical protein
MTLKRSYQTEAEIPTEFKPHYVPKDGKYVLDVEGFDNVESVLAKNSELLGKVAGHATELSGKQTEIDRLNSELSNARSSGLPRGHKAVPTADAELLDTIKAAGITKPEEFISMKTEHAANKVKVETQEKRERLDAVRKRFGWNDNAVQVLELIKDLPDIEDRDLNVNGKTEKVPHAKIRVGEEVTFQPFDKYFEEKHPVLLPSVVSTQQETGTLLPSHGAGGGSSNKDFADSLINSRYGHNMPKAATV